MRWRGLDEVQPEQHTSLKAALDERRALMQQYVPADTQALHRRVVDQLVDAKLATSALAVGAAAPPFELTDHNGVPVRLATLIESGPAVLFFFRGRWCPFCVAQLEAWSRLIPATSRSGIAVAAISPMTPHQAFLTRDQHRLDFPLLCDAGNKVARQFRIVYSIPDEQRAIFRRTFVNLPMVNGDDSWELPMPATFAIDRNGKVLFSSANPDYTIRPEPLEVLEAVEKARSDGS
jgi:peroxiredoxin